MNKKIKTLLMAGLVTVMAGSSVVSSSALSRNTVKTIRCNGAVYLCINGVKHKITLGCTNKPSQNKPSQGEDNSIEDNNTNNDNNQNAGENNNQDNNTNTGNNQNNNQNNNDSNVGDNNDKNDNTNNDNTNNDNNVVEKPNNNNSSESNEEVSGSFSSFQQEVVRLVNVERSKRGLSQLTFNAELSNVATIKSQDMINKNYFSHTSPTYGSPFDMMKKFNISYKAAGENIAKGQTSPAQVVNSWMNSQGHRENILSTKFTDIGIGVAKDSNGTLYWTQMFIGK